MTTAITTFNPAAPLEKADNITAIKSVEDAMGAIARAFPGELPDEERARKALAVVDDARIHVANAEDKPRNALCQCVSQSVIESLVGLASVDLSLNKVYGHAFLVPFKNVCTLMLGYKGLGELIYRTGVVASIQTGIVYKGDVFDYELGTDAYLKHKPQIGTPKRDDDIIATWCLITMKHGPPIPEVIERDELEKIRLIARHGKKYDSPVYKMWLGQMWRKAPLRRVANKLPKQVGGAAQAALAAALDLDNRQFDHEQYAQMEAEHSDDMRHKARKALAGEPPKAAALSGAKPGQGPPATDGQAPPPKGKRKLSATVLKGRAELWEAVKEKRADTGSTLGDKGFMAAVIESLFGKGIQITSTAQLKVLQEALFVKGLFDWPTGAKIPPKD